ncbi:MAG: hypothetical protein CM15mP23_08890 [Cryomorphaceae bacterium]|nr:MAG: hypothetical protein CM15mP23_08890 [Cryomorphaceae bacterium]
MHSYGMVGRFRYVQQLCLLLATSCALIYQMKLEIYEATGSWLRNFGKLRY